MHAGLCLLIVVDHAVAATFFSMNLRHTIVNEVRLELILLAEMRILVTAGATALVKLGSLLARRGRLVADTAEALRFLLLGLLVTIIADAAQAFLGQGLLVLLVAGAFIKGSSHLVIIKLTLIILGLGRLD